MRSRKSTKLNKLLLPLTFVVGLGTVPVVSSVIDHTSKSKSTWMHASAKSNKKTKHAVRNRTHARTHSKSHHKSVKSSSKHKHSKKIARSHKKHHHSAH